MSTKSSGPADRFGVTVMRLLEVGLSLGIATLLVALSPYALGLPIVVTVAPFIYGAARLMG